MATTTQETINKQIENLQAITRYITDDVIDVDAEIQSFKAGGRTIDDITRFMVRLIGDNVEAMSSVIGFRLYFEKGALNTAAQQISFFTNEQNRLLAIILGQALVRIDIFTELFLDLSACVVAAALTDDVDPITRAFVKSNMDDAQVEAMIESCRAGLDGYSDFAEKRDALWLQLETVGREGTEIQRAIMRLRGNHRFQVVSISTMGKTYLSAITAALVFDNDHGVSQEICSGVETIRSGMIQMEAAATEIIDGFRHGLNPDPNDLS